MSSSDEVIVRRRLPLALRHFLATEVAGGVFLLTAALIALLWVNSPLSASYDALWHTELAITVGPLDLAKDLQHWVNEGLMAIFFFVVGLEIKRELVIGELNTLRTAAMPAVAALGGMVVPAAIYAAFNFGGPGSAGWGIPMATDIAFALGVLALVLPGAPTSLRVFLLSLAIVDDIGAILVIALFYVGGLDVVALGSAVLFVVLAAGLRAARIWFAPLFLLLGVATWVALVHSGVHATIAGVAFGLLIPARPLDPSPVNDRLIADDAETDSVAERVEHRLHPWTSYAIVPLFALANAGIALSGSEVAAAATSRVTWGIVAGLVLGKIVGITGAVVVAARLGIARVADDLTVAMVAVAAAVAGIGFTVALFITQLAFADASLRHEAKVGVFAGSLLAATIAAVAARFAIRSATSGRHASVPIAPAAPDG